MWIERIEVPIKHLWNEASGLIQPDQCHIALPEDVLSWAESMRKDREDQSVAILISSTSMPGTTAIVIGNSERSGSAFSKLHAGDNIFGFVVDMSTLRELQGAITAAIAAAER